MLLLTNATEQNDMITTKSRTYRKRSRIRVGPGGDILVCCYVWLESSGGNVRMRSYLQCLDNCVYWLGPIDDEFLPLLEHHTCLARSEAWRAINSALWAAPLKPPTN